MASDKARGSRLSTRPTPSKPSSVKSSSQFVPLNDSLPSITAASPHTIVVSRNTGDDDFAVQHDVTTYIGANPVVPCSRSRLVGLLTSLLAA